MIDLNDMAGTSAQLEFQLLEVMAWLQVEDGARQEMREFFLTLPPEKQTRVLEILRGSDPDLSRLVIATVPKMREALQGAGDAEQVMSSAVTQLS